MKRRKIYRRKIVGGFFGNIFTTIAENIPGIARKVAPIALDTGKAFATGAASSAGTAVGQKYADSIKGPSEIKRVISDIPPTVEIKQAMIDTTKRLLSPRGEEIVLRLVKKTAPITPAAF